MNPLLNIIQRYFRTNKVNIQYYDLYKYSPTFAVFFGAFAYLPNFLGLSLWNILNALVLFFAVYYLPKIDIKKKSLLLFAVIIELMTSLQNSQSNALIAGLLILAFGLLEREKYIAAIFCIVFTVYIKIFGIVALLLLLFYPKKGKLFLITASAFIIYTTVPLLIVPFSQLKIIYLDWLHLLAADKSVSYGISVYGWLKTWFNIELNKSILLSIGAILLCFPFIQFKKYKNYSFRLLSLCSILIWVIIFNYKAESPTFIIAMAGVSIWYFFQKQSWFNTILFISALIFTSISSTDLFPREVRLDFIQPYMIKAIPCILIWIKILYDLFFETEIAEIKV